MTVPTFTLPDGGVSIAGNAGSADLSNILRGMVDGSNDGVGPHPELGLETRVIQRFPNLGALNAAYPPEDTTVDKAPYLACVYAPGDDFAVGYRLDPVAGKWTPTAGFAGMQDGAFDTAGYAPIGPGETRGLMTLVVPNVGLGQALVTVSAAARISFSSEDDLVDLVLRVKIGTAGLTEVRRATVPAPKSLANTGTIPSYSFFVNPGDGFTLQTIYTRIGGAAGTTCSASSETRYTNLQFVAQTL